MGAQVCSYIEQVAEVTISEKGRFVIGVSGGSVASLLNRFLPEIQTDWTSWHVFLCDERIVAKGFKFNIGAQYYWADFYVFGESLLAESF